MTYQAKQRRSLDSQAASTSAQAGLATGTQLSGPRQAHLDRLAARLDASRPVQRMAQGLPASLQAGVEALSGLSMDHVRVHYNSSQPARLQAHAFAQGQDIHLAPGQERHLPHEAWHVVQQAQGRVPPTAQLKQAVALNDDPRLEREADVMGAKAARLQAFRPGRHGRVQRMARLVAQLTGEDNKQIAPQRKWVHPAGAALQSVGFLLLASVARKPQYARLSFKSFRLGMLKDLAKIKLGMGATVIGNHMMGTEDALGSATRSTRFDQRPPLTARQDQFNWLFGLGHAVLGGAVGHRALMLNKGLGKVPLGNFGALVHALIMFQLLSTGTKLMGKESLSSELIRASKGLPSRAGSFPHTPLKEGINDAISQVLFTASLGRAYQIARMNNLPWHTFRRMRMKAMAGAGMLVALNLTPAASLPPLLLGQKPQEVSFDPAHNPLDVTRTMLGLGGIGIGAALMNSHLRQAMASMNWRQRKQLMQHVRMFGFAGTALYAGLTLAQILPVVYKLTHPDSESGSGNRDKDKN